MNPIDATSVRENAIQHVATNLLAQLENGVRIAAHEIERIIDGINLVIDCNVSHLSSSVEQRLNELVGDRTDYQVKMNIINGICQFKAHLRIA